MSKKSMILSGLASTVFAAGAHANLLADGSFESMALAGGNYGNLLENFSSSVGTNWSNSSNWVLGISTSYTEVGPLSFVAQDGGKSIDLTGAGNQGPVKLSQTVNVATPGTYLLSFWLGDVYNTTNYASSAAVKVLVDGTQQGGVFTHNTISSTASWAQQTLMLSLPAGTHVISFSTSGLTLDNYTGLDNVVLTPVPEPSAWLMLLAGLATAGFVARRRSGD